MAVGPGVDVAFSSPTPIGHMDRVWWAGVAYSPKAPEWLVGVWTPCTDYGHTVALGKLCTRVKRGAPRTVGPAVHRVACMDVRARPQPLADGLRLGVAAWM